MIESSTFVTDVGRVRSHNEDSGGVFPTGMGVLAVIADGMGGHSAGDVASKMTTDALFESWKKVSEPLTASEAEQWLKTELEAINESVFSYAAEHKECEGMGTTALASICTDDYTVIAHIGDSRAYIWGEDGFVQRTEDHSLVGELVRSGQISEEEADQHPRKNVVLRALGTEQTVKVDSVTLQAEPNQLLLLCSDGLSNKLTLEELKNELDRKDELEKIAEALVKRANDRGGEDNISLAIVRYQVQEDGDEIVT
ncbi:Stp1/IreP family PP2C-type Ser/Thr phosphatase [Shouchella shacheensis]|uniref:Stp1/IreP family PP2C-type Ser/Thr phosphatase n=1 Tax=Shouchella shacheensis TaxID=1649580 RepID=UPI00073FEFE6|nr:Stp1/IreP family PP2C-type Ser/Thr phosphatase [Shouchella shacheensis]